MIKRTIAAFGLALLASGTSLAAPVEVRVGLPTEPLTLDPSASAEPATGWVAYGNIFETLTRVDKDNAVIPVLAASWAFSGDGLVIAVKLRADVRFHDGTDLDAGDVKFSIDRIRDKLPGLASVKSVDVVDPLTLTITLTQPDPDVIKVLGTNPAVIVAPESAENNATAPIGTGPFALYDWFANDRIVLERNEDYWGPHPPVLKAVFTMLPGPDAALEGLESGRLDGVAQVSDLGVFERLRDDPRFVFEGNGIWKAGISGMPDLLTRDRVEINQLRWAE